MAISHLDYSLVTGIKQCLPIDEACRRYLPGLTLKRRGRKLWARCIFHDEKTPSLCIWPESNRFKCFGCQAKGDQIDIVAKTLNMDNEQAIRFLAKDLGIKAPESTEAEKKQIKQQIYEQKRLSATADRFINEINRAWLAAANCYRLTQQIINGIQTEQDLERHELAFVFDFRLKLETILDDLESDSPEEQLAALTRARRYMVW